MLELLKEVFREANERFIDSERELILLGVSERCLCGAFLLYLREVLNKHGLYQYYSDVEYNRVFDGRIKTMIDQELVITNITCDLIVHSRGRIPELDNLIALEMKRDTHPELERQKDRRRLCALTSPPHEIYPVDGHIVRENVCGYLVGVFYEVSISEKNVSIEYYENGALSEAIVLKIE